MPFLHLLIVRGIRDLKQFRIGDVPVFVGSSLNEDLLKLIFGHVACICVGHFRRPSEERLVIIEMKATYAEEAYVLIVLNILVV